MASEILRGSGNITYVNNTGQNVRIIINYLVNGVQPPNRGTMTISWGGSTSSQRGSAVTSLPVIGRNIANYFSGGGTTNAGTGGGAGSFTIETGNNASSSSLTSAPTELMLKAGDTFTVTSFSTTNGSAVSTGSYNIVVIPEAG
jgi:hypothetical protein